MSSTKRCPQRLEHPWVFWLLFQVYGDLFAKKNDEKYKKLKWKIEIHFKSSLERHIKYKAIVLAPSNVSVLTNKLRQPN